jgi:hypothetical protein
MGALKTLVCALCFALGGHAEHHVEPEAAAGESASVTGRAHKNGTKPEELS